MENLSDKVLADLKSSLKEMHDRIVAAMRTATGSEHTYLSQASSDVFAAWSKVRIIIENRSAK